jgi:glycosyltransferase involved in cell wall biosynthesis
MAGRLLGIPSLVHVAGGELAAIPDIGYGTARTRRGRMLESFVLRRVSAVTAASTPVIDALSALGIAASRVPLGVDLTVWPARAPERRARGGIPRLIHVASLNRVKDQTTLLYALSALVKSGVQFSMDMVGEDTLNGEIQGLAQRLQLSDQVKFHGFLPQRQLRPLMEQAHLMVISSRHETGPLVALEAAIAGVPTVGTAVGHLTEWAPSAAVSVPVGNFQALSTAIRELLSDENRRVEIACNAHKRAIREDASHTAERYLALYSQLIRPRRSPA